MTLLQVGDSLGEMTATRPPQSMPAYGPPAGRVSTSIGWKVILAVVGLVAVSALIVGVFALARPMPTAAPPAPAVSTPSYTAAQIASAQQRLCGTYTLAAHAVAADTNGDDKALARIADTNAAVLLDDAANDPALDANVRAAAKALASAYATAVAKGSATVATDAEWRAALADINAKDGVLRKLCDGR
jgi:hypothetical protein